LFVHVLDVKDEVNNPQNDNEADEHSFPVDTSQSGKHINM